MPSRKNAVVATPSPAVPHNRASKLGERLRSLSDKALSSGITRLSQKQIQRLVAEIRGGSA